MGKLGSFGAAVREYEPASDADTFEFFGETFTVQGVVPSMLSVQLGAAISGKVGRLDGHAAIWQALRSALSTADRDVGGETVPGDESEFNRFCRLAVRKRCDEDTLIELVFSIIGAQAGKAGTPPGTSSPGSPDGSPSSNSSVSASPA